VCSERVRQMRCVIDPILVAISWPQLFEAAQLDLNNAAIRTELTKAKKALQLEEKQAARRLFAGKNLRYEYCVHCSARCECGRMRGRGRERRLGARVGSEGWE
jgi:hypothetical protein